MSSWAIFLYILEVLSLLGVFVSLNRAKSGPVKMDNAAGIFGLAVVVLGYLAIYMLTAQSRAEHAIALGVVYAMIITLGLPNFFMSWAKGRIAYTYQHGLWTGFSSVLGIALTSMLAFA